MEEMHISDYEIYLYNEFHDNYEYEFLFLRQYQENLVEYLNLPAYFYSDAEKFRKEEGFFNYKLIRILEKTPYNKNILMNHLQDILIHIDDYGVDVKLILIIYIYILLDTQPVIDLLLSNVRFKTAVMQKLTEIYEYQPYQNTRFLRYMLSNFTINKRFLSIEKNSEYKKRMFRNYMKIMVMCDKWYDNTLEKRYAPEGNGAIEAKNHFIESVRLGHC